MEDLVRITVDEVDYKVRAGRTILQALDDCGALMNGADIPHYCWHPKLSIDGSCRLCQVEVGVPSENGVQFAPGLQIACNTPVCDGMVVKTQSQRVRDAREGVMELLLVNHPLDCPICDQAGECALQDYALVYGASESRTEEPRRAGKKRVALGETVLFDQERCILCRRCVRFCREVPKTGELGVFARGDRSVIETFPGSQLDNPYSMNVVDICPVGALTTRDFRFRVRVWDLAEAEGVCTGCAKGCNVWISASRPGRKPPTVYRYVPRRNDAVNETWMCDAGRLSYREIGSADRLTRCLVRGPRGALEECTQAAAVVVAAARLTELVDAKGPGVIAGVASGHASNEDLYVFRRLLDALGVEVSGLAIARGDADHLLVEAEKAANGAGARALGFDDAGPLVERLRGGGVDGLIVMGHDILGPQYLSGSEALERLDTVIALDTHHTPLERVAAVVFPARHAAEKNATFTNSAGRVQRVRAAVAAGSDVQSEGETLAQLGAAMGLPGFAELVSSAWDERAVSAALSHEVAAFHGIDLDTVGAQGRPLATVETAAHPAPQRGGR